MLRIEEGSLNYLAPWTGGTIATTLGATTTDEHTSKHDSSDNHQYNYNYSYYRHD